MDLLPEDARSQRRVLGVVLLVGAAILFFAYVYLPEREEMFALGQRVESLEQRNRTARLRTGDLDETRAELERGEQLLDALQELVPARSEVASIYEALAARSDALGLELVSVAPSRKAAGKEGFYRRQRWDMIVEGQYHDLGSFLAQVASLSRVVRPEVRSIEGLGRTSGGRHPVRAELSLETFVLVEEGAAGAGEEGTNGS